ncbi:hypothetical protein GETHPA_18430 [Geothrix rubra]|uniref:PilZ domain-containing protein n=1 Tax=Geothrix rubra TaxID=2927977 RepID=A0ABQ5Q865_9BACT|nr:PilZ domain-containing protein [Geothrix rubra]GLH70310.1 hypothetical protein GETHPA_18430 [Geothrix rubra]
MNQVRTSGGGGQGVPVENPLRIRHHLEELRAAEAEFPIKVEGTHTLPYTARVAELEKDSMHLKLIRPLPHELAPGAPFEMLFATAEQRFKGLLTFQGRQGYLLYRFTIPNRLVPSDQRQHKRYAFRPREKAYVMAQDGGVPGFGLAGPLVNLSLGGLAFRVDRVVRLDDHMRLTPGLGFFEKGKTLPMLKVRDLPKLPLFEARGMIANACEREGEIIVGVQFGELRPAELAELQEVLDFRERMQRASSSPSPASAPREGRPAPAQAEASPSPSPRTNPAGTETPAALKLLGRRTAGLVLAMPPGPLRDGVLAALAQGGYLRVETVDALHQALALLRADKGASNRVLLALDPTRDGDLAEIQALQRDQGELRELPVALLGAGAMPSPGDGLIRPLPLPGDSIEAWLDALDEIAGLAAS